MKLFAKAKNPLEEVCKNQEEQLKTYEKHIQRLQEALKTKEDENAQLYSKLQIAETQTVQEHEKLCKIDETAKQHKEKFEALNSLFGYENQHLKNALLDLQHHISTATSRAKESLQSSETVEKNFDKAFEDINVIVEKLQDLLQRSNKIADVVKDLSKKAQDIERSVELINEVVMQIKILSLNASVEAASAGEAGKGFAVVAMEIKNLANKTSSVATEINDIVKAIQLSTENTGHEFYEIDDNIQTIHTNTNNFSLEIHTLNTLTKNSLSELNILGDSVFMSLAKIDHIIWKVNTYLSVHQKRPVFNFVNHKQCRLGKWYFEGEGKKYFSTTQNYTKLDKPHANVHNDTHKIFDQLKQKPVNYTQLKETFESIEENSKEVFNALNEMMKEVLEEGKSKSGE